MRILTKFLLVFTAMAIMGFIIPDEVISQNPNPQETDVAISYEYYTEYETGGDSQRSPTYHALYSTPSENTVRFNNYANIHDERIQSTEYHVIWYISVYENMDGEYVHIATEESGDIYYSPPDEIAHYQSISIDVEMRDIIYHEYWVGTTYDWYKVNPDGTEDWIKSPTYGETAIVYEVDDLPVGVEKSEHLEEEKSEHEEEKTEHEEEKSEHEEEKSEHVKEWKTKHVKKEKISNS